MEELHIASCVDKVDSVLPPLRFSLFVASQKVQQKSFVVYFGLDLRLFHVHDLCISNDSVNEEDYIVEKSKRNIILMCIFFFCLKALNGGIVMVNFYNNFINCAPNEMPKATLSQVAGKHSGNQMSSLIQYKYN